MVERWGGSVAQSAVAAVVGVDAVVVAAASVVDVAVAIAAVVRWWFLSGTVVGRLRLGLG